MDQDQQCPVCTLFLHGNISLAEHLDTHPKDQVIKALCNIQTLRSRSNTRSNTPHDTISERSYRSASRTPVFGQKSHTNHGNLGTEKVNTWKRSLPPLAAGSSDFYKLQNENINFVGSQFVPQFAPPFACEDSLTSEIQLEYDYSQPKKLKKNDELPEPQFVDYGNNFDAMIEDSTSKFIKPLQQFQPLQYQMDKEPINQKVHSLRNFQNIESKPTLNIATGQGNITYLKNKLSSIQYLVPSGKPLQLLVPGKKVQPGTTMSCSLNSQQNFSVPQNNQIFYAKSNIPPNSTVPLTAVLTSSPQMFQPDKCNTPNYSPFIPNVDGNLLLVNTISTQPHSSQSSYTNTFNLVPNFYPRLKHADEKTTQQQVRQCDTKNISPNVTIVTSNREISDFGGHNFEGQLKTEETIPIEYVENTTRKGGLKILSNIKVEVPIKHHKSLVNKVVDLTSLNDEPFDPENEAPDLVIDEMRQNTPDLYVATLPEEIKEQNNSNDAPAQNVENLRQSVNKVEQSPCSVIKNVGNPANKAPSLQFLEQNKAKEPEHQPELECTKKELFKESLFEHSALTITENVQKRDEKISEPIPEVTLNLKESSPKNCISNSSTIPKNDKEENFQCDENTTKESCLQKDLSDSTPTEVPDVERSVSAAEDSDESKPSTSALPLLPEKIVETFKQNNIRCVPSSLLKTKVDMFLENNPDEDSIIEEEGIKLGLIDKTKNEEVEEKKEAIFNPADEIEHKEFAQLETMCSNVIAYGNLLADHFKTQIYESEERKNFIGLVNDNYFNDSIYNEYLNIDRVEGTSQPLPVEAEFDWSSSSAIAQELNICADEKMPAHGELSGQESNADMEASWEAYNEMNNSVPYDLIARESWNSDCSDIENSLPSKSKSEEPLEEKPPAEKKYKCSTCHMAFLCPKERRVHRTKQHPTPSASRPKPTKAPIKKAIKKEPEEMPLTILSMLPPPPSLEGESSVKTEIKPEIKPDVKPKLETLTGTRTRFYTCNTCKQEFTNETLYSCHLKIHPLECLQCGKYFYKKANLQLHYRIHLGNKKHKCEICNKAFYTKPRLKEHSNIHSGNVPFKCTVCDERFKRYSAMVLHRNKVHFHIKKKQKDFVCHCGEVLHSARKLLWHKEIHDEKPKTCPHCGDKFVHTSSLTRHIRRAHNAYYVSDLERVTMNIPCPVCNRIVLKQNLETHLRTHTGKRPFSCVVCDKRFTTKWNLKLHKWTHASRSSKPHACQQCPRAFVRPEDLSQHLNSHRALRPYTCNHCGRKFMRKNNCQRHVREHDNEKRFKCTVADCDKKFHRSYYLAEHMRVHSGLRPYACGVCGKTSASKSNHNKHLRVHHARDPVPAEA